MSGDYFIYVARKFTLFFIIISLSMTTLNGCTKYGANIVLAQPTDSQFKEVQIFIEPYQPGDTVCAMRYEAWRINRKEMNFGNCITDVMSRQSVIIDNRSSWVVVSKSSGNLCYFQKLESVPEKGTTVRPRQLYKTKAGG